MTTTVSRDVIMDLLPAYLSGEASADTRSLIEDYMKQDAEFATHVKSEAKGILSPGVLRSLSPDREMEAMRRTKRLLRRRAWHLAAAIFFTLTAVSYQYGPEGFKWTWHDAPSVSVLLLVVGAVFWVVYFRSKHRLKITGV